MDAICTEQVKMDTYVGYLNQNLDILLDLANELLEEELKLPGIPAIPLPKSPDILLRGWGEWDRPLHLRSTPIPRGYTGNVYPLRHVGKRVDGRLRLPGTPDVLIDAPPGIVVPGVDPSTQILQYLNLNLTILFDALNEAGYEVTPVLIPFMQLCPQDSEFPGQGPGVSPGQIIVDQILSINETTILAVVPGCTNTLADGFDPLTDPGWEETASSPDLAINALGADFVNWTWDSFPGDFTPAESGQLRTVGNLYTGLAPSQLSACGNAARLDYDFSVFASLTSGSGTSSITVFLRKIAPDNTVTNIDVATHSVFGTGSSTGSNSLNLPAGSVTGDDRLTLLVALGVTSLGGSLSGSGGIQNISLVDLGP